MLSSVTRWTFVDQIVFFVRVRKENLNKWIFNEWINEWMNGRWSVSHTILNYQLTMLAEQYEGGILLHEGGIYQCSCAVSLFICLRDFPHCELCVPALDADNARLHGSLIRFPQMNLSNYLKQQIMAGGRRPERGHYVTKGGLVTCCMLTVLSSFSDCHSGFLFSSWSSFLMECNSTPIQSKNNHGSD